MIEPCSGRIAVLVATASTRTPTGLYLPEDTARSIHEEKPTQGLVIGIGEDVTEVEIGDTVLFGKYTGTKIKYRKPNDPGTPAHDAETVIIMSESAVLCKLLSPDQAANLKVRG